MLIGYTRIAKVQSAEDLNIQKNALIDFGCQEHNIYTEETAREEDRVELLLAVNALRKGDKLVVPRLSSFGYDLTEIGRILEKIENKSANLVILDLGGALLDSSTKVGASMLISLQATISLDVEEMRERKLEELKSNRHNYAQAI